MRVITLTGPSCSGKTTLLNELLNDKTFAGVGITSHTTRPPRPAEVEGVDYYFVSQAEFDTIKANNEFIESISFNGFSYGVSVKEITNAYLSGKTAVLIVEPKGLIQIQEYAKTNNLQVFSVYINGDINTLVSRYISRLKGENLESKQVSDRHATRIISLLNEHEQWKPDDISLIWGTLSYDKLIHSFNDANKQEVLNSIKKVLEQ